jgi:hypothetical protein
MFPKWDSAVVETVITGIRVKFAVSVIGPFIVTLPGLDEPV